MKLKLLIPILLFALVVSQSANADTYTVINTNDTGAGSFRQAITDVVTNAASDTIAFNIPRTDANYVTVEGVSYWIIKVASALPSFDAPFGGGTVIDGTTQTSNVGDDNLLGPEIMISAEGGTDFDGFNFPTSNTIKSLIINGFGNDNAKYAVNISGDGNTIWGCYIGTTATASSAAANPNDLGILCTSANNYIGSTEAANINVISGNAGNGIEITGSSATGNYILGNNIGVDRTAAAAIANSSSGILINTSAAYNYVGDGTAAGRNIISGNSAHGLDIQGSNNVVNNNFIGTDAGGTADLGNTSRGVYINSPSGGNISYNTIEACVISGNNDAGIDISDNSSGKLQQNNYIFNCLIGTTSNGATGLPNGNNGINIGTGSNYNYIGDGTAANANTICSNEAGSEAGIGILINSAASSNEVSGNYIGTNSSSDPGLGNQTYGIQIGGAATFNIIGGETATQANIISGNASDGVNITGAGTNNNKVISSYIGTDVAGTAALANAADGVYIDTGPQYNIVGSETASLKTVISGNDGSGVGIDQSNTNSNEVRGCYIGVDSTGTGNLGNSAAGVGIDNGAQFNIIGGTAANRGNVISGNTGPGVSIGLTAASNNNYIYQNYIGMDSTGNAALANENEGIVINNGSQSCLIGDGASTGRNIISGNTGVGVNVTGAGSNSNIINNNYIGTILNGTTVSSNGDNAVDINGTISGAQVKNCTIKSNGFGGVYLHGGAGTYEVSGNTIVGGSSDMGILAGQNADNVNSGTISTNEVRGFAFGITSSLNSGQTLTARHCTLVYNTDPGPPVATGFSISSGTANITNCIIANDPTNEAVFSGSVGVSVSGASTVANVSYSDVYGNTTNYSNGSGTITLGTGTISAVAKFTNAVGNDFTLAHNSPCIDTGTPGATTDMGAYQYGMATGGVPAVRVISPNGAESWEAGSAQTITWYASQDADGISTLNFSYSTDGGTTYTLVTSESTNDGTYAWTVPIPAATSTTCKVSLEAITGNGQSIHGTDESDANFTIYRTETDGPAITIEAPTTGDIWQGGSTHNITFQATDVKGIKANSMNIYYSTDEGTSYPYTITSEAATTSPYSWILPTGLTTTGVKVKVDMQDDYNQFGTAESNSFTIDSISPEVGSITLKDRLNGGSVYSNSLIVSIEASNVSGSPNQMNISSEATFAGSTWETYAATSQFTFSGSDGTKEAYFKVRDAATNESSSVNDSIIVDTIAPTAPTLLAPTNNSNTNDATPAFSWSAATDATSGVGSYEVRLAGTIVATTSALTYTHAAALADGTYTWEVRARDLALNYGVYSATRTFILDTTNPDSTKITISIPTTDVPVNSGIQITFPATMDTTSVQNAFSLEENASGAFAKRIRSKAVSGTFSWNTANTTMTFTPSANLNAGSTYTLGISTAAKDQFGNAFSSAYSASFTTAGGDTTAPTISLKVRDTALRSNDYIPAAPTFQITATDNQSITAEGVTMRLDGAAVTLTTVSTTSTTVTLSYTPSTALADENTMTHILTIEARDVQGNTATTEITGLKVSDGSAKITGGVLTYPTQYKPLSGGVLKIGYQLSVDAQTSIYLISKYGVIAWTYKAESGAQGGKAGYNEIEFGGQSDITRSYIPNGLYMIKVIAQNKVIGSGHVLVLD